jgi:CRP/FNR family transcriptional regulator
MTGQEHPETPLFQGLNPEQIDELSSWLVRMEFVRGQEIFAEGSPSDGLYIVARGTVEVLRSVDGKQVRIAELESPCVFGEMALLNRETHSATIRSMTRVTAGYLSQDLYETRVAEDNLTAMRISLNLGKVACQRLRATTEKMLHMAEPEAEAKVQETAKIKAPPELKKLCTRFLKGDAS